jgi:hypothetical protein
MGAAQDLFDDLLTLEVNLILKSGMTARKMPDLPHALLDIFSAYDIWLCAFAGRLNEAWTDFLKTDAANDLDPEKLAHELVEEREGKRVLIAGLEATPLFDEKKPISANEFDTLRERARTADEMNRLLLHNRLMPDDGSASILKRIYRNCDQIKGILEGRGTDRGRKAELSKVGRDGVSRKTAAETDLPLTADENLVIRKAWEVGVEEVVMQTVAQLDGDVVTRVQQARMAAADRPLHELHRSGIATALEHWQFLVKTFVQITSKAADFLTR